MNKVVLTVALTAALLGLPACGAGNEASVASAPGEGRATGGVAGPEGNENEAGNAGAAAAADWPTDVRVVEEGGNVFRVDADGKRVPVNKEDLPGS